MTADDSWSCTFKVTLFPPVARFLPLSTSPLWRGHIETEGVLLPEVSAPTSALLQDAIAKQIRDRLKTHAGRVNK